MMIEDQPPPVPSNRPAIVDLVVEDMVERKRIGIERYGMPLQSHNGRDALIDAYQEALDLVMYLRQAIEERPCPIRSSITDLPCLLPFGHPMDSPTRFHRYWR
jgi:hypothetical protein